ncbi:hypothetical protein BJX61DRAFT_435687 [Aspergillus egyptiacus]|nr:hypothetical protein BJX61DRAFT_435687 [Aspergillus egyptiacus]
MWFVLFKIFRFGYSEAKKHKAKKAQQQQQQQQGQFQFQQPQYPPNAHLYASHQDVPRAEYDNNNNGNYYAMDQQQQQPTTSFPDQTPLPTPPSKRAKAKELAALLLAFLQFAFGLAVIGLYSQDINAARDSGANAPSKWVYAVVTAFLSTVSAGIYMVLGWWWRKRGKESFAQRRGLYLPLFVWEGVLVVLWLVVFGIFGEMYIGVYHVGGQEGGERKVTRMRRAVWVDLACLVFWVVSATWRGVRWWRGKKEDGESFWDGKEEEV